MPKSLIIPPSPLAHPSLYYPPAPTINGSIPNEDIVPSPNMRSRSPSRRSSRQVCATPQGSRDCQLDAQVPPRWWSLWSRGGRGGGRLLWCGHRRCRQEGMVPPDRRPLRGGGVAGSCRLMEAS
jgi:hypothetical protein